MSKSTLSNIFDELDDIIPEKVKPSPEPLTVIPPTKASIPSAPSSSVVSAPIDINEVMRKLKEIEADLNSKFYEREEAIKVMMVALISKMSVFFVGTPGTGR